MPQLTLPPYAARLVKLRMAGRHPKRVVVLITDTWPTKEDMAAQVHPTLVVGHRDYAPGVYDWRCVTDLWVVVEGADDRKTRALMGELADRAGPVMWREWTATGLARAESDLDSEGRRTAWPWWWSQAREDRHWEWWASWGQRVRDRKPVVARAR